MIEEAYGPKCPLSALFQSRKTSRVEFKQTRSSRTIFDFKLMLDAIAGCDGVMHESGRVAPKSTLIINVFEQSPPGRAKKINKLADCTASGEAIHGPPMVQQPDLY